MCVGGEKLFINLINLLTALMNSYVSWYDTPRENRVAGEKCVKVISCNVSQLLIKAISRSFRRDFRGKLLSEEINENKNLFNEGKQSFDEKWKTESFFTWGR